MMPLHLLFVFYFYIYMMNLLQDKKNKYSLFPSKTDYILHFSKSCKDFSCFKSIVHYKYSCTKITFFVISCTKLSKCIC